MPDTDDLEVIRELLAGRPPSEDVSNSVKGRLTAVIAAGEHRRAGRPVRRSPRSYRAVARVTRRRLVLRSVAGVAAVTGAAALVLVGLGAVPGHHATGGHGRTVVTPAWTVREDAAGTVTITVRQYAEPARLQRVLRADGINAIVRATPRIPNGYCYYATTNDASPAVQRAVVTVVWQHLPGPRGGVMQIPTFIIHPAAMPRSSALFLPFATNTLATPISGPRVKAPPMNGPHRKAFPPAVLNNDTVPACVPITKPAPLAGRAAPRAR